MDCLLQPFFALLTTGTDSKLAQMVEYLKAENAILRAKLPTRITVTATEKARLVQLGAALGGALKDLITIVSTRTFARGVAAVNGTDVDPATPTAASTRSPAGPAPPRTSAHSSSNSPARTAGDTRGYSVS